MVGLRLLLDLLQYLLMVMMQDLVVLPMRHQRVVQMSLQPPLHQLLTLNLL
jgi:hypothetical protein